MSNTVEIDGESLCIEDLMRIGYNNATIRIAQSAWDAVKRGRSVIDDILLVMHNHFHYLRIST